jgi:hypothetical protein
MNDGKTYSIKDVQESDPRLEKYRKDVLEKYLEYGLVALQKAQSEGKTIEDVIDQAKTVLWYVKNERMQQIQDELGL